MFRVAVVYKVNTVQNNNVDKKNVLYHDIDQYEDITPALKTCEFYNSVYNYPLTSYKNLKDYAYEYVTDSQYSNRLISNNKQVFVGYVVYDTRKPLYKVVGLLNDSNIGEVPKPVYDPNVYYESVPYEVARMSVDYYNDNEPYRDTPQGTIFKYDYFPMNHY